MARRHGLAGASASIVVGDEPHGRLARLRSALGGLARAMSARPWAWGVGLLAADLAASAAFAGAGVLAGDTALFFRELMPGTWLSFAQLLFAAGAAWAIHEHSGRRSDLWGLSAVLLVLFAADEITQASQFAGIALSQGAGLAPAGAFHDLGAVILTLAFCAAALAVLPRALVLLRHPVALAVLALAVTLGAGSQALDSFVAPSAGEFVAEETLKLCAEAVLIGGLLLALRDVRRRDGIKREAA